MARPSLGDKAASITITLRVSPEEKAGLERLVKTRQAEFAKLFPGVEITSASLIRGLIQREIANTLTEKTPTAPKVESKQLEIPSATPTPRETNSGKRKPLTEESVRARLVEALASRATTAKKLADTVGTYHQMVSSWKSGRAKMGDKLAPMSQALVSLGY